MFQLVSLTFKTSEDVQLVHDDTSTRQSFTVRSCPAHRRMFSMHGLPVTLTPRYFQMLPRVGSFSSENLLSGSNLSLPVILPQFH